MTEQAIGSIHAPRLRVVTQSDSRTESSEKHLKLASKINSFFLHTKKNI